MRYLSAAFWARPSILLLRLPWNALAVAGAAIAGFFEPAIWGTAAVGEFLYLITLGSNPGFRQWVDSRRFAAIGEDSDEARAELLRQLGGAARQHYVRLEEKRKKLEQMSKQDTSDDLLFMSNRDALRKLTWLFLKLLVAERALLSAGQKTERADLERQIEELRKDTAAAPTSAARDSREATLALLHKRMESLEERQTSLAEIESDLRRIETQIDAALDDASLRGRPAAISAQVQLTSHLLGSDSLTTYSSGFRETE